MRDGDEGSSTSDRSAVEVTGGALERNYRSRGDRRLKVFGRMDPLAEFAGHYPVCWRLLGITDFGGPVAPQLGTFGVDLLGHHCNRNKARKNSARGDRWR